MTLSPRYAKRLIALLLLFAVPTLAIGLVPPRQDDCRDPALLFVTALIEGSKPVGESLPGDTNDVIQWSYGEIAHPETQREPLRFQIVRSYDRNHAEPIHLLGGTPFEAELHSVQTLSTPAGPVPIHVAVDHTKRPSRLAAWLFVYDGRPVASPFLSVLASAPRQLVGGTLPITILMVDGTTGRGNVEPVENAAKQWLAAAWQHVATACR
jgi:hypothetical protein